MIDPLRDALIAAGFVAHLDLHDRVARSRQTAATRPFGRPGQNAGTFRREWMQPDAAVILRMAALSCRDASPKNAASPKDWCRFHPDRKGDGPLGRMETMK